MVQAPESKFGLHAGQMKFSTQNEERISTLILYFLECKVNFFP